MRLTFSSARTIAGLWAGAATAGAIGYFLSKLTVPEDYASYAESFGIGFLTMGVAMAIVALTYTCGYVLTPISLTLGEKIVVQRLFRTSAYSWRQVHFASDLTEYTEARLTGALIMPGLGVLQYENRQLADLTFTLLDESQRPLYSRTGKGGELYQLQRFAAQHTAARYLAQVAEIQWQGGNVSSVALRNIPLEDSHVPELLSALRRFPELETLDLSYTQITDAGLESLSELKSIRKLIVDGCDVRPATIDALENEWRRQRENRIFVPD